MRYFAVLVGLLLSLSCSRSLEQTIRKQVASFESASLGEDQVQVSNIQTSGDQAVAEIQVKTGVKLVKVGGKWIIDEVRLGDRRWEKASHIIDLVNEKRTQTTLEQLRTIEDGIGKFAQINRRVPQVSTIGELMDVLAPDFQASVMRLDAWSNPFGYQAKGETSYDLRSAGPDGKIGTADDLKNPPR